MILRSLSPSQMIGAALKGIFLFLRKIIPLIQLKGPKVIGKVTLNAHMLLSLLLRNSASF